MMLRNAHIEMHQNNRQLTEDSQRRGLYARHVDKFCSVCKLKTHSICITGRCCVRMQVFHQ